MAAFGDGMGRGLAAPRTPYGLGLPGGADRDGGADMVPRGRLALGDGGGALPQLPGLTGRGRW